MKAISEHFSEVLFKEIGMFHNYVATRFVQKDIHCGLTTDYQTLQNEVLSSKHYDNLLNLKDTFMDFSTLETYISFLMSKSGL